MNVIGIAVISAIAFSALLGMIVGMIKGFAKVSSWGVEYLLTCALTLPIGAILKKNMVTDERTLAIAGVVTLVLALVFLIIFRLTSGMFRAIFRRSKEKKMAQGKRKKGPSGFFDVIFGGFTLGVKCAVITGMISAFILVALDVSQLAIVESMQDIYTSGAYTAFKPYLMDCMYIALMLLALKCGYHSGISNVLWTFIMLGLVVFAGIASYNLAFNVQTFKGIEDSISGKVNEFISSFAGAEAQSISELIAKIIITAVIFILMLVVVLIINAFVPKLLCYARDSKLFYSIDGVLGSVIAVAITLGILLVIGNILQPFTADLEKYRFIETFSSYFKGGSFAGYFVNDNLMTLFGVPQVLLVVQWLG